MCNYITGFSIIGTALLTFSGVASAQGLTKDQRKCLNAANANAAKIDAIIKEENPDLKLSLWLQAYLKNTRFDDGENKMAPLVPALTSAQIDDLVAYLLALK